MATVVILPSRILEFSDLTCLQWQPFVPKMSESNIYRYTFSCKWTTRVVKPELKLLAFPIMSVQIVLQITINFRSS